MDALPDPRRFPDASAAPAYAATLHRLATGSLAATTAQEADVCDRRIDEALGALLAGGDGNALARVLETAPSLDVHRHLWRALARRVGVARAAASGLDVTLFAIPLVIVAASTAERGSTARVSGILPNAASIVDTLRAHDALRGNRTLALSNALTTAEAIDIAKLPGLIASRWNPADGVFAPIEIPPVPFDLSNAERAYLRFLVGTALAAPGVDLLGDDAAASNRWRLPLARALIGQLAAPGVSLLALPRGAMSLPAAVMHGRAAQREISAQLFASNALRELRARVGEPVAVISAHEAADAPGGGELRLSLSSPFAPRDAHGFRCPLYPGDHVADVAAMLVDLLRDCRLADIRVVGGVHGDGEPITGAPLLFKPDTVPAAV